MDLAISAVEGTFGVEVSYVSPRGDAAVTFSADYQRSPKSVGFDLSEISSYDPRLDIRQATLQERGIVLEQGGLVTFTAEGERTTFALLDVSPTAVGSVSCTLGRRSRCT